MGRSIGLAVSILVAGCGSGSARPGDAGRETDAIDARDALDQSVDADAPDAGVDAPVDVPRDAVDAPPDAADAARVQRVLVAVGTYHTCVVTRAGRTYCAGGNADGQLGAATLSIAMVPSLASGVTETDVAVLVGGAKHNCAATSGGRPTCWGSNLSGQLGNDSKTSSPTPVAVSGLIDVASLAAGTAFSCAGTQAGTASCWGKNNWGQLGKRVHDGHSAPRRGHRAR